MEEAMNLTQLVLDEMGSNSRNFNETADGKWLCKRCGREAEIQEVIHKARNLPEDPEVTELTIGILYCPNCHCKPDDHGPPIDPYGFLYDESKIVKPRQKKNT